KDFNESTSLFSKEALNVLSKAEQSCALKHFLAWKAFLKSQYKYCLIFEDDIFLACDFIKKFTNSLKELDTLNNKMVSIQYSNAANLYTPKQKLKPNQYLYPNHQCRAADAYLITTESANARISYIEKHHFTLSADWQTNLMDPILGIQFLWFERPIAEQGSQSGKFDSSLQVKKYPLWITKIKWAIKRLQRKHK
ncbi:glycosyltransferase family 25 protein, partial [Francisellaceae bacterium]|nr:glycosyltransferase family 25 protein [Francisellaceae bacterium]